MSSNEQTIIARGLSVLELEARAIQAVSKTIGQAFVLACNTMLNCQGRVVVTGMGKSGHIARKIAATLASTGTPAIFLHPAEASHGDLGMITQKDVLLLLSYSGETDELLCILPLIKRLQVPIISLTGNPKSRLAECSNIHLDVGIPKEACPLGLAPTASTTASLAMGDALALSILELRGFTADDFAQSHPRGRLGRRLLLKIEDIMHKEEAIPRVTEDAKLLDAVLEMTGKSLGFTTIVMKNDPNHLLGIFTDGDLRRTLEKGMNLYEISIKEVMSKTCKKITTGSLAYDAIHLMESEPKSFALPVLNPEGKLVGAMNMHNLLKAGVL